MTRDKAQRTDLIGAVIAWVGIFAAAAITLEGDDLTTMLIIPAAGAFWFVVIAPQLFLRIGRQDDRALPPAHDVTQ
jgi:hypothetical protein